MKKKATIKKTLKILINDFEQGIFKVIGYPILGNLNHDVRAYIEKKIEPDSENRKLFDKVNSALTSAFTNLALYPGITYYVFNDQGLLILAFVYASVESIVRIEKTNKETKRISGSLIGELFSLIIKYIMNLTKRISHFKEHTTKEVLK